MGLKSPASLLDWFSSNIEDSVILVSALAIHVFVFSASLLPIELPIARPLISALYLSIVPGLLLLSLVDIDLEIDEVIIYSLPLSWAFLMGGMLITTFLLRLEDPLSKPNILISTGVAISALFILHGVIYGMQDSDLFDSIIEDIGATTISKESIYALIVLSMSLISTLLIYNKLRLGKGLTLTILAVAFVPVLIYKRDLSRGDIKFVLVTTSISLLLLRSLLSPYANGFDIIKNIAHVELSISTSNLELGLPRNYSSILTPHVLGATYHHVGGITVSTLYKFVTPVAFGIVVTGGCFRVYNLICNDYKKSAFSFLLLLFSVHFFLKIPTIVKQLTAEVFFVPLVLLIFESHESNHAVKIVLSFIFAFGMVVSHYSVTWIIIAASGIAILSSLLIALIIPVDGLSVRHKLRRLHEALSVRLPILIFIIIITISWYSRVGQGRMFEAVFMKIYQAVSVRPRSAAGGTIGAAADLSSISIILLQVIIVVLMGIGMIVSAYKSYGCIERWDSRLTYLLFSGGLASIGLMYVFSSPLLGLPRYAHILTLIAAPFAVKAVTLLDISSVRLSSMIITGFLIILLVFNSGAASLVISDEQIGLYNVEEVTYSEEDIKTGHFVLSNTGSIDRILGGRRMPLKFNSQYLRYPPDSNRLDLIGHTIVLHQINAQQRNIASHYCARGSENFVLFHSSDVDRQTMQLIPGPRGGGKIQGTSTVNPWKVGILNVGTVNKVYDTGGNSVWKIRCHD